jgi:hypothetical protein
MSRLGKVATVSIVQAEGTQPVKADSTFTLEARVDGGQATAFQWKFRGNDLPGATNSQYQAQAKADTVGKYTVAATVDGQLIESSEVEVKLADASTPGPVTEPATPEAPPEFHLWFAILTAIPAAIIGTVILLAPARTARDISESDLKGTDGDTALAASLAVPLTVLGGASVVLGAWMAMVEWRGRFKKKEPADRGFEPDVGKIIEAIGKLRGAALVMVVGALLMLGGAWVAQSLAEEAPTTATTTTTTTNTP